MSKNERPGAMDWQPQGSVTPALIEDWRRIRTARGMASGDSLTATVSESVTISEVTPGAAQIILAGHAPSLAVTAPPAALVSDLTIRWKPAYPDVLVKAGVDLVNLAPPGSEGQLVTGVAIPWFEIIRHLEQDPGFLFTVGWRKLEEIIAGAFDLHGFDEVILTPRSGDEGRDVIATRHGVGSIRIFDQVKAYNPGLSVTADDVRSMLGTLSQHLNVSKGMISTTSTFAPGIAESAGLAAYMPHRLELQDGPELRRWLLDLAVRMPSLV